MGDRIEALRIITRCESVAELVTAFERYVDGENCFIPTRHARAVGTEIAFSIRLADGTAVLRGAGVVRDLWIDDANPFHRPGLRIAIARIAPQSRALYERLLPRKCETDSIPVARLLEKTERAILRERDVKTVETAPLDFALESESPPPPPPLRRARRPRRALSPHRALQGIRAITQQGVPIAVADQGSSTAVSAAPLILRWWLGVVAFALVVAMWLLR